MSSNLTLRAHIFSVYQKAGKRLNMLTAISYKVNRDTLRKLYKSVIRPVVEYADGRLAVLIGKANSLNRFSVKPLKSSQVLQGKQGGFAIWESWGGRR